MRASASVLRQLRLLLRKNVQIHRRNYVSTTVQLCLPIFISFMLWVLRANDKYNRAGYNAMTFELRHPPTIEVAAFPACDACCCCCCWSGMQHNNKLVLILTRHTLAWAGLANRLLDRHEVVTDNGDVDTLGQATP